jgi:hypothetical protein
MMNSYQPYAHRANTVRLTCSSSSESLEAVSRSLCINVGGTRLNWTLLNDAESDGTSDGVVGARRVGLFTVHLFSGLSRRKSERARVDARG